MICTPCRGQNHEKCEAKDRDSTWCNCQHRKLSEVQVILDGKPTHEMFELLPSEGVPESDILFVAPEDGEYTFINGKPVLKDGEPLKSWKLTNTSPLIPESTQESPAFPLMVHHSVLKPLEDMKNSGNFSINSNFNGPNQQPSSTNDTE